MTDYARWLSTGPQVRTKVRGGAVAAVCLRPGVCPGLPGGLDVAAGCRDPWAARLGLGQAGAVPRLRRIAITAGHLGVGQSVVTTARLTPPLPDLAGYEHAGRVASCPGSLLAAGLLVVHGKEKVYGSIP